MHYALGNKYPIETVGHIKQASDYFTKYLGSLEPANRVIVASNLEKRANELNVNLNENWITNYSRITKIGAQISTSFDMNLDMRRDALTKTGSLVKIAGDEIDFNDVLDKIAELKDEGASGELLVETIEEFDKMAGLQFKYDREVLDPVMTVYGNVSNPEFDSVKVASGISDYDVKKASNMSGVLTKIAEVFGEDVSDSFSKYPLNTFLSTSAPESDIMADIILNKEAFLTESDNKSLTNSSKPVSKKATVKKNNTTLTVSK